MSDFLATVDRYVALYETAVHIWAGLAAGTAALAAGAAWMSIRRITRRNHPVESAAETTSELCWEAAA